MADIGMKPNIW